jgi:hypothetical protein
MMSNMPRYTRLIELVVEGQTFEAAIKDAYGRSPDELVEMWAASAGRGRRSEGCR